ncbi:MAG: hypothetical protein CBD27_01985 [Rhodospirillaceae bacterium TMED167]|nr:hypothetical protein [Rhodospirillaceae bacterium]OUW30261.1 MAG: hypothetical protein CBD27_01985 [Rhodospirillaceae bacterium TMED167]
MKKILVLGAAISVAACSGHQMNPGQMVGAAAGALVGGYAGSQFGGGAGNLMFIIAGGLVGAASGVSIGEQLMPSDRTKFQQSAQFAMSNTTDGNMMNWINPETGVAGTIKPVRTYYAGQNTFCREFEASIAVQDQVGEANGRACKVGGGVWRLDNQV